MSEKKVHEYEVVFRHIKNNKGESLDQTPLVFNFQNHDDIFKIIEFLSEKNLFTSESQTRQFAVGLKLFGDILIKNRDMELFSEIQPAFIDFMKKLKGKG